MFMRNLMKKWKICWSKEEIKAEFKNTKEEKAVQGIT
jgi:hypothetical protein